MRVCLDGPSLVGRAITVVDVVGTSTAFLAPAVSLTGPDLSAGSADVPTRVHPASFVEGSGVHERVLAHDSSFHQPLYFQ